jgi:hypothetical protein
MINKKYNIETSGQYMLINVTEIDSVERTEILKEIVDFPLSNSRMTVDSEIRDSFEPERTVISLISNNVNYLSINKYASNNVDENLFSFNGTDTSFFELHRLLTTYTGYQLTQAIVIS